ncbi:MAG: DUF4325 domain-containing protein [Candidatus Omnitrophota bacterium]
METIDKILRYLKVRNTVSGGELSELLGISRQAINKHLKSLIQRGVVAKEGNTKGTIYRIAGKIKPQRKFRKICVLKDLEEDRVFKEVELFLNLGGNLRENVLDIVNYVFTEILNNAIEHSKSEKCGVEVCLSEYQCRFTIRDYGIGIFHSIYTKFNLPDENSAMGELIKGKITTMREKHTGEGVFFSSKSGDSVLFRSHKINLGFDNMKQDVFVEEKKFINGTEVTFNISRSSRRRLAEIFKQYAPEEFDYGFEKTRVFVKLFQKDYVSRSEAKRLLAGLDRFKEIVLDFKDVKSIGQGFADETFRVFRRQHPDIVIKTENLSPLISPVIKHAVDNII